MSGKETKKRKKVRLGGNISTQNINTDNNNHNHNRNDNNNSNAAADEKSDDDAQTETNLRTRKLIIPSETINSLETQTDLFASLKRSLEEIGGSIVLDKESEALKVSMEYLDNERILKIVEKHIGIAISEAEFGRLVEDLISIEHKRSTLTANPALTLSNFLCSMSTGAQFIKHNEYGPSQTQWFSLIKDRLYWRDNQQNAERLNRSMTMLQIRKFKLGKTTTIFKSKKCVNVNDDCCMSIVGERKKLDIECQSRQQRDEWFTKLQFLHRHFVPRRRKTKFLDNTDNLLDDLLEDID